jgi:uncharacterized protein (TIGR02594 family)
MKAIIDFFLWLFGKPVSRPADLPDEIPSLGDPAWLKLARAEIGQAEIPGPANNPRILSYYAKAGFAGINDESVPWCAGFANAMLESAGVAGSKSLSAREFMNWGSEVKKPYPGCVAVLWRESPQSWLGHTGFYVGETATHVQLLGGNQQNKVCIEEYPKHQLLGYREPFKAAKSRTMKASTVQMGLLGLDSAVVLESQGQLSTIGDLLGQLGVTIPQFLVASILLKLALVCWVIHARQDDATKKGR